MPHQFSVELPAPRGPLFDFLADPRRRPEWQSSIRSLTMLSDGEPRVGMKWKERAVGFGAFEMEISALQREQLWAERGRSNRGTIDLTLRFHEGRSATSTLLALSLQLRFSGVLAWGQSFAPWVLWPLMRADLFRAAQLVSPRS